MSEELEPCGCDEATQHLWQYLDSEVEESMLKRVHDHLDGCPDCSAQRDWEERVRSLLRRSCIERAPEELRVQIYQRITVIRSQGYDI